MRILFLAPRFPYPPLRGDQVRAYHQIRVLSRRHGVTLVAVADHDVSPEAEAHMRTMCERIIVLPLTWRRGLAGLARLLAGDPRPAQTLLYAAAGRESVLDLLEGGDFDVVHAQLLRTVGLAPTGPRLPLVVDLVDALSASYRRRMAIARPWLRPALAFEARRLARFEEALLQGPAHCLLVSEADGRALGAAGRRAIVNPNGVDPAAFPFSPETGASHRVVFVGNLGYPPNSDAVIWFVSEVLPRLRSRIAESELVIVGPRAPRAVRRLARTPGVAVAGEVPDVHAALAAARVAVAPLRAGAGMQNKVLEAMATGTPVVATPRAVSGIEVEAGTHCLVADTPDEFAAAVAAVLRRPDLRSRLVRAAHGLVAERYTWERSVAQLEALYAHAVRVAGLEPAPAPSDQPNVRPGAGHARDARGIAAMPAAATVDGSPTGRS
jgi:sugar transferase (PEP-CTERM/EpsH1 system associated)